MIQQRINSFYRSFIEEISKVSWPSRIETTKLTIVVIVVSVFVGTYVGMLDVAFARVLQLISK